MMQYLELQKREFCLKTGEDSSPAAVFMLNQINIVIIFQSKYIIMDTVKNKIQYQSSKMQLRKCHTVISPTSFAYVVKRNYYPCLQVFNLSTLKRTTYGSFYQSCVEIIYLEAQNNLYASVGNYWSNNLFLFDKGNTIDQNQSGRNHSKYSADSIVVYGLNGRFFNILKNKNSIKYQVYKECSIKCVKQYSNTEALIGLGNYPGQNQYLYQNSVLLYSLIHSQIIKQCVLKNPIDSILKLQDSYFTLSKDLKINQADFYLQECFSKNATELAPQHLVIESKDLESYYKDDSVAQMIVSQNKGELNVKLVELRKVNKRHQYIFIMESNGIIEGFRSEIVKSVINNLV